METVATVIQVPLGGVSVFIIKGERPVLVDAGMPGSSGKILKALSQNSIKPEDISLIILTHVHLDHFGGLKEIKEITKAKVAVHEAASEFLKNGKNEDIVPHKPAAKIIKIFINLLTPKDFSGVEPDVIIRDEMDLEEYGIKGRVISTPGHTPGSLSIILENGGAITGDMLSNKIFAKNTPNISPFATDLNMLKSSIQKVMSFNPEIIYSAHGGPFKPDDVRHVSIC